MRKLNYKLTILYLVLVNLALLCWAKPPNVVVFLTDDQGWGDLSLHNNPHLQTPYLDRLAESGAQLERFYVSPVCAPTRASLLTGKFHSRTGVHGVTRGQENMDLKEVTLADLFKEAGYRTGIFGKWHNGAHYPYHPNGRGFDQFVGFSAGHLSDYFDAKLEENGRSIKSSGFIVDYLTDRAIEFIDASKNQPFFCYIPYNTPHSPLQVPDKYFDKYKQMGLDDRTACVYGMCENIDDNVGRVMQKLEESGLRENTIVIFFSDNGPDTYRFNGGLKGKKGDVHEGGMKVPCFVSWPKAIAPRTGIPKVTAHVDLLPSLMDMIGRPDLIPCDIDGKSLRPLLENPAAGWPDRTLYMNWGYRTRIWNERYALAEGELYDLLEDPNQTQPLGQALPDVKASMERELQQWLQKHVPANETAFAIPVGYPGRPVTELPAHESHLYPEFPFGAERFDSGISYVTRWGWANDWITNWTSTQAYVRWDIEVETAGRYAVTLNYTCPEKDVGSRIEIRAGDDSLEVAIAEAFDPPLYPDRDRFPRESEVHEKDWASLSAGLLKLNSGKTNLTVKALEMPGNQVMELRAVSLKRLQ
ncbi:MAG: arylsulfatase [Puniceicoccaceae bacterium]